MRKPALPVLGTAVGSLLVLGFCIVGCESDEPANPPVQDKKQVEAPSLRPAFHDWSDPAAVIVLSGLQHGYLEPCGCSETQSGGLARRADLFRQLKDKQWPVIAVDLGGTVVRKRQQSRIKFETILAALRDMPYVGVALGPEELRLDPDFLLTQVTDSRSPDCTLPFLDANVTYLNGLEDFGPASVKTALVGGVKIGVAAILDPAIAREIAPEGSSLAEKVSIDPVDPALAACVESLSESGAQFKLLMAHMDRDAAKELIGRFPQFDVVLCTSGEEPPAPERIGETLLVSVGQKGKYVGAVGLFPDAKEKKDRIRYELVDLDSRRFQNAPAMREHMKAYQQRLRTERVVLLESPLPLDGLEFVGAKKCGECHTKAYEKWKTTKHAHAFESLARGREGQEEHWISRQFDPECLACHVTGWNPQEVLRYETGFVNEEFVQSETEKAHSRALRGQQCENCHGPGSEHIAQEERWRTNPALFEEKTEMDRLMAARKHVKLNKNMAERTVCRKCHDLDNSPNFDFDKYWPEVDHPWKD